MPDATPQVDVDKERAAATYFKERVYATFTGLAIVLVTATAFHPEPDHAFFALVLGVLGITAAGFVSEIISHLAVHREFPDRRRVEEMLKVAGGAMGTVIIPGGIIVLSWVDVLDIDTALTVCAFVFIGTLALIGWLGVRRSRLPIRQQLLALLLLLALGLLVIGLQTVAHAI